MTNFNKENNALLLSFLFVSFFSLSCRRYFLPFFFHSFFDPRQKFSDGIAAFLSLYLVLFFLTFSASMFYCRQVLFVDKNYPIIFVLKIIHLHTSESRIHCGHFLFV